MKKLRIALLYGGRSVEHVVSIRSAIQIYHHLTKMGHTLYPIGIDREGRWSLQHFQEGKLSTTYNESSSITLVPTKGLFCGDKPLRVDLCFPVTHGHDGEDGTLQGALELSHLPYVGCGVSVSSIAIDKNFTKKIVSSISIPTLPSLTVGYREKQFSLLYEKALEKLGPALIVKPNDGGSSVGISVLKNPTLEQFCSSLTQCFRFTHQALIESLVEPAVELECALIGEKGVLRASSPGVVINPTKESSSFLNYEQKYLLDNGAYIYVDPTLSKELSTTISSYALRIGELLGVSGYARVDFLYNSETGELYFNEINTLPGMTEKSHWPTLALSMGYSWESFLTLLLEEALFKEKEGTLIEYKDEE